LHLLIIDDDAEYRRTLRYHIEVEWPHAVVVDHQPSSTGRGPRDVPVAGYDAVLLGHPIGDERGFAWLDGLAERSDCPPVLLFADPSDEWLAVDALKAGAASYFPKRKLQHRRLVAALRDAVERRATPAQVRRPPRGAAGEGGPIRAAARARSLPASVGGWLGARRHRFVAELYASDLSRVYLAEDEE